MKTHRVKAHERRSPSKPKVYVAKHEQLADEVLTNAWCKEFDVLTESLIRAHALPERMELSDQDREAW